MVQVKKWATSNGFWVRISCIPPFDFLIYSNFFPFATSIAQKPSIKILEIQWLKLNGPLESWNRCYFPGLKSCQNYGVPSHLKMWAKNNMKKGHFWINFSLFQLYYRPIYLHFRQALDAHIIWADVDNNIFATQQCIFEEGSTVGFKVGWHKFSSHSFACSFYTTFITWIARG